MWFRLLIKDTVEELPNWPNHREIHISEEVMIQLSWHVLSLQVMRNKGHGSSGGPLH